jgi:NDP-sugar pyrophosphorylase family protein
VNIVMPMAGRGSRFASQGIATPKPLIDVLGKPMYAWATESLPLSLASRIIFICLREHLDGSGLEADIRARYGHLSPVIVPLDGVTEGQACTVLTARQWIDDDQPLLIFNADTWCRATLDQTLPATPKSVAGILGVFRAEGDRWSFARTDSTGRVVETAEKRRISDLACTGLYHFGRGDLFVDYAERMIRADDRVNREFYVAPVYNRMIADGLDVRVDVAVEAWALGTPEDLKIFLDQRGTDGAKQ